MLLAAMGLLFVVASAWMTRPLWRKAVDPGQRRRAANIAAYRQRVAELEADAAVGLIAADTLASLRGELDIRLLRDAGAVESQNIPTGRQWALSAILVLLVPAVALVGYVQRGTWRTQAQMATAPQGVDQQQASVEQMIQALAQRMEQHPSDVEGWVLLGRAYLAVQRYTESAAAYAKANAITAGQDADLLANQGEALALAGERSPAGATESLFEAALKLDPAHRKALWYAGLAAEQAGDLDGAKRHWRALSSQDLPDPLRAALDERLRAHGIEPPPRVVSNGPLLRLAVSLAPELASRMPAGATLFVFAKAADGPPMPLAVHRRPAQALPLEVRLDDSMAMTPAAKLSAYDRWIVTARVSASGGAQAISGDLQGSLTVAQKDLGDAAMALVIDQVVP